MPFHNLPKYDRSGQVVHYTAVEVWVDGSGRELSRTELAQKFPDAYALIRSYSTGYPMKSTWWTNTVTATARP